MSSSEGDRVGTICTLFDQISAYFVEKMVDLFREANLQSSRLGAHFFGPIQADGNC